MQHSTVYRSDLIMPFPAPRSIGCHGPDDVPLEEQAAAGHCPRSLLLCSHLAIYDGGADVLVGLETQGRFFKQEQRQSRLIHDRYVLMDRKIRVGRMMHCRTILGHAGGKPDYIDIYVPQGMPTVPVSVGSAQRAGCFHRLGQQCKSGWRRR